jgi:hypothetical protein
MKWYQKPIAAVGAISVAYHEVLRGRRTGVCTECGRLNHATADYCLCGGRVDENEHAPETLDDPSAGTTDSFDRPVCRFGVPVFKIVSFTACLFLLAYAIRGGSYAAGFTAFFLGTLLTSTGGLGRA